ncbi:beta-galactosidase-1-like protein 3 [Ctenodactylus gundi]
MEYRKVRTIQTWFGIQAQQEDIPGAAGQQLAHAMGTLAHSRFNWTHLSPANMKARSVGLGTTRISGGKAHFTLEGHEFLIFGGSIHYFRVPREYWRDRLLKLRACGFNTVTTYIPWNLHEPERGKFDFSGNLDLEAFVLLAAEIGLWVILRPGPYICAEVDLGGLPSWLLQDPKVHLRTTSKGFVDAVDRYFDHLIPRARPLQYHRGGPVIAVQVENEYGSFNKDKRYMAYLKAALLKRDIVELLLTSDNDKDIANGSVKGALATVNLGSFKKYVFDRLLQVQFLPKDTQPSPLNVSIEQDVEQTVSAFIKQEISFNTYMFHGGTNFGFMNAASFMGKHISVVTSYGECWRVWSPPGHDYDAVLTEAGDYTEKYFVLRKLLGSVSVTTENLPVNDGSGQSFGFILYETSLCSAGRLHARAHDEAQVFLNTTIIGLLRLTDSVRIDDVAVAGFTIYSLEMKMSFFERLRSASWKPVPESYLGPAFYRGILRVGSSPRDTFLSLPSWDCGFLFVNGRNLGRYWKIGPQKTLYLPGAWLHPGDNEVGRQPLPHGLVDSHKSSSLEGASRCCPPSALAGRNLCYRQLLLFSQIVVFEKVKSGSLTQSADRPSWEARS